MDPITVTVEHGRSMIGIGLTKTYDLIREHRLVAKKIDGRTVITVESIRKLIEEAPQL